MTNYYELQYVERNGVTLPDGTYSAVYIGLRIDVA